MSGRVSDARAGRAGTIDILAVGEGSRNGGEGGGGASEELEAEAGGLLLVTLVEESAVAVIGLTVGILIGGDEAGGHGREDEGALHVGVSDW